MAKKTSADDTTETTDTAAAEPEVAKRDPLKSIGFETGVHGEYSYLDDPKDVAQMFDHGYDSTGAVVALHARVITYGGRRFEHKCDDGDGVWIYRSM